MIILFLITNLLNCMLTAMDQSNPLDVAKKDVSFEQKVKKQKVETKPQLHKFPGPIPRQLLLVTFAYKECHRQKEIKMPMPEKVLLFGPQGSGKSFIVKAINKELQAHISAFTVAPCADDIMQQALMKQCEMIAQEVPDKTISVMHCCNAQHLFKGNTIEDIMRIINNHIAKMIQTKMVPTLFIAEQRECPESVVVPYFDQVVSMPKLKWKDRQTVLEFCLQDAKTNINWEEIDPCDSVGLEKWALKKAAKEAVLEAASRETEVSNIHLESSLKHWRSIVKRTKKNNEIVGCPTYLSIYS